MKKENQRYITESAAQTRKAGYLLAKTVLRSESREGALVLLLRGDLGSGKTHFIQGFAKGLGIKETVNSPTFTIMKKYQVGLGDKWKAFYHIDCYRLKSGNDLLELGLARILADAAAIAAIEWPSVISKEINLKNALILNIEIIAGNRRRLEFYYE